eukprot:Skav217584  [mRNA]  locus=scaffold5014:49033:51750:- [translate_table: standard]
MSWHCRECNLSTPMTSQTCRSCKQPWNRVWQRPKRRSRSQQRPSDSKAPKDRKQSKEPKRTPAKEVDDEVFPAKAPWVPSTLRTRNPARQIEQMEQNEDIHDVPPPPVLPAPPAAAPPMAALTPEEEQVLKHLRGLGQCGITLTAELKQQMEELQAKEKVQPPMLSHSHLNKLRKIQNQLQAIAKKVGQVDTDWKNFTLHVSSRIQDHVKWYTAHREELIQQFQAKSMELQEAKREVSQACHGGEHSTTGSSPKSSRAHPGCREHAGYAAATTRGSGCGPGNSGRTDPGGRSRDGRALSKERSRRRPEARGKTIDPSPHGVCWEASSKVTDQGSTDTSQEVNDAAFHSLRAVGLCSKRSYPWGVSRPSCLRSSPSRRSKEKQTNYVSFSNEAELFIFWDDECVKVHAHVEDVHLQCRALWHIDGQISAPHICMQIAHRWQQLRAFGVTWGGGSSIPAVMPACCGPRESLAQRWIEAFTPSLDQVVFNGWQSFESISAHRSSAQPLFIETWLLHSQVQPCCVRPRRFRVVEPIDKKGFLLACLQMWFDLLLPNEPIDVVIVTPSPESSRSTAAHVIITQAKLPHECSILLQSDAFASVQRVRAVLVHQAHTVVDVFRTAQAIQACTDGHHPCFIEGPPHLHRRYVDAEVFPKTHGALLQGDVMVIQQEVFQEEGAWTDPSEDVSTHCASGSDSSPSSQCDSSVVEWNEIPDQYLVEDVFDGIQRTPWVPAAAPQARTVSTGEYHEDMVSLMQRQRGRSTASVPDRPIEAQVDEIEVDAPPMPQYIVQLTEIFSNPRENREQATDRRAVVTWCAGVWFNPATRCVRFPMSSTLEQILDSGKWNYYGHGIQYCKLLGSFLWASLPRAVGCQMSQALQFMCGSLRLLMFNMFRFFSLMLHINHPCQLIA